MDSNILSALNQGLNQTLFPGRRVIRVNGWQSAEKYPMPRDCEAIFLDSDPKSDYIYMKATDSNGGETFERYLLTPDPIPKFEPGKYVTVTEMKNEMKSFKEDILHAIDSLKQSTSANYEQRSNRPNGSSKQSGGSNNELHGPKTDIQSNGQ